MKKLIFLLLFLPIFGYAQTYVPGNDSVNTSGDTLRLSWAVFDLKVVELDARNITLRDTTQNKIFLINWSNECYQFYKTLKKNTPVTVEIRNGGVNRIWK